MPNQKLGFSVYLSTFEQQKLFLEQLHDKNRLVFTSLHIPEEMNENFISEAMNMLRWLNTHHFTVICDISRETLEYFGVETLEQLANKLNINMLRIDYGFEFSDILTAAKTCGIVFNASTINLAHADQIDNMFGLHNYYPREYTGLSLQQLLNINKTLNDYHISSFVFIPNAKESRGPIFEGLPTLEHQRYQNPYVSFIELSSHQHIQGIILSDLALSTSDLSYLTRYETEQIVSIPAILEDESLYNQVFTIRVDSPETSLRLSESRTLISQGVNIEPTNTITRKKGAITCDNKHFLRYAGEIQIIKQDLPKDHRVNVIGHIQDDYVNLCSFIKNGSKITFTK